MYVVSLKGVSKRYRIFPRRQDQLKRYLSFGKAKAGREFWALENINLDVEAGTTLGIIGRNGAGKTTLLRIISGVLQPTSGTVTVYGRLVALFALGAGFDDEYTGRENVILNGLILGIDRKEILERFDEIEAFADIGDFMYQPVKTYSSGMRARLGFAVAVTVEPDILVVDEALATGDAAFKTKGIQKMRDLQDAGTTVLFVSHGLGQVKEFCDEAALLHQGALVSRGDTDQIIEQYHDLISEATARQKNRRGPERAPDLKATQDGGNGLGTPSFKEDPALGDGSSNLRHGTGDAKIRNVELLDESGRPVDVAAPDSNLTVRAHVQYMKAVNKSDVGIILRNDAGLDIFSTNTTLEKSPLGKRRAGERVIVDFTFRAPLKPGRYDLATAVSHPKNTEPQLDNIDTAAFFEVSHSLDGEALTGLVRLPTQVKVFEPDRAG
jgi:ABC-type polysaccharide/polyol phosphate transport system ATPase subunit